MQVQIARKALANPAPPRLWNIGYLDVANRDSMKIFTPVQHLHLRDQIDDLSFHQNPRLSETQDVRGIDDFFELRDKGNVLRRISARVFFAVYDVAKLICVLGCHKKENEGKTPGHIVRRIRNRKRYADEALEIWRT